MTRHDLADWWDRVNYHHPARIAAVAAVVIVVVWCAGIALAGESELIEHRDRTTYYQHPEVGP